MLSGLLASRLCVLFVHLGPVFGAPFALLMHPFTPHLGVACHVAGGLFPTSEQLVQESHFAPFSGVEEPSIGRGPTGSIARALARKARTPPPPRRPVQAPRRRVDARDPDQSRRALYFLAGFALLGVLILGGVVLWLTQRDSGDSQAVAETMRAAGCTYQTFESEGREHVRDGTRVSYNSSPPTSGNHYAVPVIWNAYDAPVEQARAVHNLEHGGIVIQYGDEVPEATVNELREFYQSDPNGLLLAPLPGLNNQIALTAWTHLAKCRTFNEGAFEEFRDEFRAKGPEPRRPSDLAPGTAN